MSALQKTKRIIQRSLDLKQKYNSLGIYYLPIENGCICENCGRIITNISKIKGENGNIYHIGLDCLETIVINNNLLDNESYLNYLYSDKPALQKAKSLRAKILKYNKKYSPLNIDIYDKNDCFGFSFSTIKNNMFEPLGFDYTFNTKYKDLTLCYIKDLLTSDK